MILSLWFHLLLSNQLFDKSKETDTEMEVQAIDMHMEMELVIVEVDMKPDTGVKKPIPIQIREKRNLARKEEKNFISDFHSSTYTFHIIYISFEFLWN